MPNPDKPSDLQVSCPQCGRQVAWSDANRWRPFCSERCKLIDLGEWLDERRSIPGDPVEPVDPETPH